MRVVCVRSEAAHTTLDTWGCVLRSESGASKCRPLPLMKAGDRVGTEDRLQAGSLRVSRPPTRGGTHCFLCPSVSQLPDRIHQLHQGKRLREFWYPFLPGEYTCVCVYFVYVLRTKQGCLSHSVLDQQGHRVQKGWLLVRGQERPFSSDLEGRGGQRFSWEAQTSNSFLILD